jgi:hypothetical protein
MLKTVLLNKKKVPIPVPIKGLNDLVTWIDGTFVASGSSITKIVVDGRRFEMGGSHNFGNVTFTPMSVVEVQIDSPLEISIQTVDALRNLASMVHKVMEPLAVECWQVDAQLKLPTNFATFEQDLELLLELTDHLIMVLDGQVYTKNLFDAASKINKLATSIKVARVDGQWRPIAKIMLNQLLPAFDEFSHEISLVEKAIFEEQADRSLNARKSASSVKIY